MNRLSGASISTAEVSRVVSPGLILPRVRSVPESGGDLGFKAVGFARNIGMRLDPEQEYVLENSLGVREDGRWKTREVGVNVPRQNGKGEILLARELFGIAIGERLVIHTAHEFKTSAEHFMRVEDVVRNCEILHANVKRSSTGRIVGYRYSHGEESIQFQNGARIEFKTRTKSGMRGFAGVDLLVIDEAMIISDAQHSSAMPIIRASKAERGAQLWYAGSAVDQLTHHDGLVWASIRERGLAGDDDSLAYFEWSLDFDHPDDVPDEVLLDTDSWRSVNFAIGRGRVLEEHMEWERRAMTRRGFAVELLGVGDYPSRDGGADRMITDAMWADIRDESSVLQDPVCISFDVSPSRSSAIVAVGGNQNGVMHAEIVSAGPGTAWVADKIVEVYANHQVVEVVCDGYGMAASIAQRVEDAGVAVRKIGTGEYAQACGLFADSVANRELRHLGQPELDISVRGSRTRPLVDRWAWSRTKSLSDQGPLIAATIALMSAVENHVMAPRVFVF